MTQEEKARAYDEALEKAREIKEKIMYSHLSTESCKAVSEYIDAIIPELAESEDERIRKQLIDAIKIGRSNSGISFTEEAASRYIAWLEKQKDINCLACDQHLKGYLAGRKVTEEEKQKEQKPAEWRHYIWATNLRFDFTALIKYDNTDNYEIVQAGNRPKQEKNGVYILIKDIKPQSHWKPSEHQMNILKAVKDYVGKGSGYWGEGLGSLIDDLEKLM